MIAAVDELVHRFLRHAHPCISINNVINKAIKFVAPPPASTNYGVVIGTTPVGSLATTPLQASPFSWPRTTQMQDKRCLLLRLAVMGPLPDTTTNSQRAAE